MSLYWNTSPKGLACSAWLVLCGVFKTFHCPPWSWTLDSSASASLHFASLRPSFPSRSFARRLVTHLLSRDSAGHLSRHFCASALALSYELQEQDQDTSFSVSLRHPIISSTKRDGKHLYSFIAS